MVRYKAHASTNINSKNTKTSKKTTNKRGRLEIYGKTRNAGCRAEISIEGTHSQTKNKNFSLDQHSYSYTDYDTHDDTPCPLGRISTLSFSTNGEGRCEQNKRRAMSMETPGRDFFKAAVFVVCAITPPFVWRISALIFVRPQGEGCVVLCVIRSVSRIFFTAALVNRYVVLCTGKAPRNYDWTRENQKLAFHGVRLPGSFAFLSKEAWKVAI